MATSPIPTSIVPAVQVLAPNVKATNPDGSFGTQAFAFFRDLTRALAAIIPAVNSAIGVTSFALAAQPTLTAAQAGAQAEVTDYGHFVVWTGTVWQYAAGDLGNGFYVLFAIPPAAPGWALCNGTTVPYLVVGGATLTTALMVLPTVANTYFRQ